MKLNGNTILITGGGSGIGRALAERFHALGNTVIITGRRESALAATVAGNPGIHAMTLDVRDPDAITAFAAKVTAAHPALNVVVNNAGIMVREDLTDPGHLATSDATIATNLAGPIRLNAALLGHLRARERGAILNVSSGLASIPLAPFPTYCATKAAIHSYSQSLSRQLRGTSVQVIEIVPPYVQTELTGADQAADPRAMPLADYIAETFQLLEANPDAGEILVERVKMLRFAEVRGEYETTFGHLNDAF
ncbi:MAG: SDR family oxidoreductase [Bryobacteraceae bacterium]